MGGTPPPIASVPAGCDSRRVCAYESHDPFIGREPESAGLRDAIAAAREGRGGVILVSGPAGIGKSRLVEEVLADEPDALRCRCPAEAGTPPLWPWRRILGRIGGSAAAGPADITATADAAESAAARFGLMVTLTDALVAAAEEIKGLVVVVEDLHDADEASLALLRQVAREAADSRLLVIATHRDPPDGQGTALARTLADIARSRSVRTVRLAPFTHAEVAEYFDEVPGSPPVAAEVLARTGGLPLLVAAVARVLATAPQPAGARVEVPAADLRLLVGELLRGLDPEIRETGRVAAVLGEDVDTGLLAEVRGLSPADVSGHLAVLGGAGLMTSSGEPARYRFAHALVREGVARESSRLAAGVHRRAAELLQRRPDAEAAGAARIAAHWQLAGADADARRAAVRWLRTAAAYARRAYAAEDAAGLLGQALTTLDRIGAGEAERAELLVELATAEYLAGDIVTSLAHCGEAADAAESAGLNDLLAAAALVHGVSDGEILSSLSALCDRALDALDGTGDDPASAVARSRLLAQRVTLDVGAERWAEVSRTSREALRLAQESGDPTALLAAAQARVATLDQPEDVAERRRLGGIAIRTGSQAGAPIAAVLGYTWRIGAAYQDMDVAAADEEIARLGEFARATGLPLARWHHLRARAAREVLAGRFDQAREFSSEANRVAQRMGDPNYLGYVFASHVAFLRGDPGELLPGTHEMFATAPNTPVVEAFRTMLRFLAGEDIDGDYARLRQLLRDPLPGGRIVGVLMLLTELAEGFGDAEAAGWAYEVWRPWAGTGGMASFAGVMTQGACALEVGRMAMVLGRRDEAIDTLRSAAAINLRMDALPWLIVTWLNLAGALQRRGGRGDLAEADGLLSRAAGEARRLDMPGWLARADRQLADLRAARRRSDPLSPREREVADLVAQALTNRQIAERLFLSERTVESHLSRILAKLNVSTRTELAAQLLRAPPVR